MGISASQATWAAIWTSFLVFGVASLLGWNTWINTGPFFRARLVGSPFYDTFMSYFASCYFAGNITFLVALLFLGTAFPPRARIIAGFSLSIIIFAVSGLMTTYGAALSASTYFGVTLFLVILTSLASSLSFGVIGLVSEYAPICAQSFSTGQGLAGLIPAVGMLLLLIRNQGQSVSLGDEAANAAKTFYTSMGITLVALVAYFLLPLKPLEDLYQPILDDDQPAPVPSTASRRPLQSYHTIDSADPNTQFPSAASAPPPVTVSSVFAEIRAPAVAVLLNFAVTLAVYPATTSSVESVSAGNGSVWTDKNVFTALGLVLFNVGDMVGKAAPGYPALYVTSNRHLLNASLIRLLFVPALLLCNTTRYTDDGTLLPRHLPVVFGDFVFLSLVLLLGGTGGWLGSNLVMWGPESVKRVVLGGGSSGGEVAVGVVESAEKATQAKKVVAGDTMMVMLTLGLAAGSLLSFVVRLV